MTQRKLARLIAKGHVLECPCCGKLSAYAWQDCDERRGIAHIPAASCFEWQCGH